MQALRLAPCAFALGMLGCGPKTGPVAPSWQKNAVDGDCEIVAAVALDSIPSGRAAAMVRAGSELLTAVTRMPTPSGQRLEACARMKPQSGEIAAWVVAVRGVKGDVPAALAKAGERLPNGAVAIGRADGNRLFVWPRTMVIASNAAADRVATLDEGAVGSEIDLPGGVLAMAALRGEAAKRVASEHGGRGDLEGILATALMEGFLELRASGDQIDVRLTLRYESEEAAMLVERAVLAAWKRAGDAAADGETKEVHGTVAYLAKLRPFVTLDLARDGASVRFLTRVSGDGRAPLPPRATPVPEGASPGSYEARCPPGERFDLDHARCVTAR
jgi:hypothetical protein